MRYLLLSKIFAILAAGALFAAADIEIGFENDLQKTRVDTPLLGTAASMLQAEPVKLPEPAEKSIAEKPAAEDLARQKHMKTPAAGSSPDKPPQADFPETIGAATELAAVEQKGKGTSEFTATADGEAELMVFLPTYRPAAITARLLDENGEEIYFKGQSLLIWQRPDDKAFAPVFFKGSSDESSMKKVAGSNYDAVQNTYRVALQKGQKIKLEISGQPESSSYVKVKGPLE